MLLLLWAETTPESFQEGIVSHVEVGHGESQGGLGLALARLHVQDAGFEARVSLVLQTEALVVRVVVGIVDILVRSESVVGWEEPESLDSSMLNFLLKKKRNSKINKSGIFSVNQRKLNFISHYLGMIIIVAAAERVVRAKLDRGRITGPR